MKNEKLPLTPQAYQGLSRDYYEQLYANKMQTWRKWTNA